MAKSLKTAVMIILAVAVVALVIWGSIHLIICCLFFESNAEANKNQYIKNNYKGWKEIELEEGTTLKIPTNWDIVWDGDQAVVLEGERIIARGLRQPNSTRFDDSSRSEYSSFKEQIVGFKPVNEERESFFIPNAGQRGDYERISFESESGENSVFYVLSLSLKTSDRFNYAFFFGPLIIGNDDLLLEKLMAIAFSY